ncbi:MAG: DUF6497 family protein [Pseudomonadota bacterium]
MAVCAGAAFAAADVVEMPSGLTGFLQEVVEEEGGDLFRFRFVAEAFAKDVGLEIVAADLEHLCSKFAVSEVPEGARIVVSLADQPSEFGVANPGVTQVFEAFRAENGRCIWEEF